MFVRGSFYSMQKKGIPTFVLLTVSMEKHCINYNVKYYVYTFGTYIYKALPFSFKGLSTHTHVAATKTNNNYKSQMK